MVADALPCAQGGSPVNARIRQAIYFTTGIPPENQFLTQSGHSHRLPSHLVRLKNDVPLVADHLFFLKVKTFHVKTLRGKMAAPLRRLRR
jgi:hypothetical protein